MGAVYYSVRCRLDSIVFFAMKKIGRFVSAVLEEIFVIMLLYYN